MPKRWFVNIFAALFIVLGIGSNVQAADSTPPEVINKQFSSSTIAYKGNSVPGYLTISLETNEPTRGYILAVGNGRQAKINLSTTDFKTHHTINWAPWDDVKKEPLPAGTYSLKSYLTDADYNSAQGFPLGQITIVQETNPKALITISNQTLSTISPKYGVNENLTDMNYELSRHAEVQIAVQKDGTDYYQTGKDKLDPGTHSFAWNGRDQKGNIVPDGTYEIVFKTIELNYNYPATTQTIEKLGKITVSNGENQIPQWRMKELVTSASFDAQTFSPNGDGTQDTISGKITMAEPAKLTVYIATAVGSHMNHVIYNQDLQPGTHTFTWDGTEMMGGKALNGDYFIKAMVTESNGATGYLLFESQPVTVKDSLSITAMEPVKKVRVIAEKAKMTVYPVDQGYTATKGEIFNLISTTVENGYYEVLVKDNVPGKVKVSDVEILETQPEPTLNYVNHTVVGGDTLWKISQKYGVSVNEIVQANSLDVNQQLLVGQILKVPAKNVEPPSTTVYTVQSGDTLWKIAQKFNVTIDAILKANNFSQTQYLYVGQKLNIPVVQQPPTTNAVHVVQSGDTLWKIAQKYNVTINDIVQANNLNQNDHLYVGQKLTIPNKQPVEAYSMYTVQSGDTLWKIAQKHNTTIQKIVDLNQLNINHSIMVGQQLKVPTV